ncbi:MAG: ribokinase [Propionibacteriaceae bacterium]|jgi:ribokinase|nr:ribokinase [Propionibacteriaceae bacterium]
MSGVVVVGSVNLDDILRMDKLPGPGETVLAVGAGRALGGKGANQAVASALAGAPTRFAGCVGDDAAGRFLRDQLSGYGVGVDDLRVVAEAGSGRALILIEDGGENSIVVESGANHLVDAGAGVRLVEALPADSVVLTQGELLPVVIDAVAAACAARGLRFVLNLAPPAGVSAQTLAVADPLVVNEIEAAQVGIDAAAFAAGESVAYPSRSLVVTLGRAGSALSEAGGAVETVASHAVPVVDTTGAGDAFVGTLVAGLARGDSMGGAARLASAAAAFCVTRLGAAPSYGTPQEIAAGLDR